MGIRITVRLFANFRINRFKEKIAEYPSAVAVQDVVAELGITDSEVGIIFINGRNATLSTVLADGDTLSLFPLVGGG